ncbi:hypothetical protein [Polaribacter sp. HaHaR_3_91]|uniref:hypothetical protein n=1 Tax=Polaribacter sp. HaHaR_3_91 TaxID=2745561 RepID=UPI001C4F406B|nr:hypothetical protein [Polaribacter sp. HaHaR_3_91]QXP64357.1 hypothetical protein H0I27_03995 [Polaribacter sp. HaHaR_3_91]
MEESKKVLYLMQNVCDKLDTLESNINTIREDKIDNKIFGEFIESQKQILMKQHKLNINQTSAFLSIIKIEESIKSLSNEPNIINQKKEYYLFGKDSPFTSKLLLSIITFILIAFSGFKYIPSYLNENSELKTERDEYKLFYEYFFLDAYSKNNKTSKNIASILNDIQQKDTVLLRYVHKLSKQYNTQLKKEALEKQLENLEKGR